MKSASFQDWLDPEPWTCAAREADRRAVQGALASENPGMAEFAALLSPAAGPLLEDMAQKARALTRRHFGNTITLYAPLYLSDYCSGGCVYCGFAADRKRIRKRLQPEEIKAELDALRAMGFEEILLLTGERTPQAGFDYVRNAVILVAELLHMVTIEVFPMESSEYRILADSGCTGLTVYQETYDRQTYERLHRWGGKRDFAYRLNTPARALAAGMRTAGLGALLGLADPISDAIALFQHLLFLRATCWRAGFSISFPRVRPQLGGFTPAHAVSDKMLAQIIFAFRICLPDVPLVLSTRESAAFRDSMAGLGISKMSIASRTTVGGYNAESADVNGQFDVCDNRDIASFRSALQNKKLEAVFKNWDAVYRDAVTGAKE